MPGPTENVILAAFELSKAAPREWEQFLVAFDGYVADTVRRLMSSEPLTLSNYQGQAVQAQHVFHMLRDARKTLQTAERRTRKPENKSWPLA